MLLEYKGPWLEALRSGKYKQGKNFLNAEGKFCCLGVLCEINASKLDVQKSSCFSSVRDIILYNGHDTVPPETFLETVGLGEETVSTLTRMNDGYEMREHSFDEIADWIEQSL